MLRLLHYDVLWRVGGSAVASDAIYQDLLKVQQAGKPVVVSMGNLAASGGYYISGCCFVFLTHPSAACTFCASPCKLYHT